MVKYDKIKDVKEQLRIVIDGLNPDYAIGIAKMR